MMKRFVVLLLLLLIQSACSQAPRELATPTATEILPTETEIIPPTLTPSPSPTIPPTPIVYYYFVAVKSKTFPAGSVVILPDNLILGPTLSDIARSADTVTNISSALHAMLIDARNAWTSRELGIASVTFDEGTANVDLQGEYFAPGDIVLIAARYQILLTVFADSSVQAAIVTINGKNITNLGISHLSEAKPDDYTYSREEIDAFMTENAYSPP